jgi:hypothetical protein
MWLASSTAVSSVWIRLLSSSRDICNLMFEQKIGKSNYHYSIIDHTGLISYDYFLINYAVNF